MSSHTLALQLESISIITSLLSRPRGKSIAAPYEVKPPAPGAPLLTPKTDTLCWHQLDIILLKHPFVVGFRWRFIQLTKWPFIYFRGLSGERAALQQSGSSSGNTSSHHSGAHGLPSAVNAWELRSFYSCKWGSQQPSSMRIRQPFICNHSFLSNSGPSREPGAQDAEIRHISIMILLSAEITPTPEWDRLPLQVVLDRKCFDSLSQSLHSPFKGLNPHTEVLVFLAADKANRTGPYALKPAIRTALWCTFVQLFMWSSHLSVCFNCLIV